MTKKQLHRLFAYDRWANNRVLEALAVVGPLTAGHPLAKLLSHIIAAQEVWLARIQNQPLSGLTPWPDIDPETWPDRFAALQDTWEHLLDTGERGFDDLITYRDTKGHSFETMLHEILLHVIIHGQHHRAQIASGLRQLGHTPPPTDFIFFTREPLRPKEGA